MTSSPLVILHLGLGAFHRAHQAVYLQRLMDAGDGGWVLKGGNLRPDMADTMAALQARGGAFTLETVTPAGARHWERITSIREVIPHDASLAGLVREGAHPDTRIISFTVTEAGYYLDEHDRLDTRYPDLASDLAGATRCTLYGALAAILDARRLQAGGPVTLLNCDNLRNNGERFRAGFLDFLARRQAHELRDWVSQHTTCPSSMVDRITPRASAEVVQRARAATGVDDPAALMAESFIQWVIEDHFANGRPAWERVGAELVASVVPHEEAKIRILNASHSCFAWAGTLIGHGFIHEDVAQPAIRQMAHAYVTDDVIPALTQRQDPYPVDLAAYRDVVFERFGNPHLRDTNARVAMDGFAKIPGFIVPTLRDRLSHGASIASTAVLPALFFEFLARWHAGQLPFDYQDQGMDPARAHAFFDDIDPLAAFSRDTVLWGPLAGDPALLDALREAHLRVRAFLRDNAQGAAAA